MVEENGLTYSELSNIKSRLYEYKNEIQALKSRYDLALTAVNSTSEEIVRIKTCATDPFAEIERNLDTNIQIVSTQRGIAK